MHVHKPLLLAAALALGGACAMVAAPAQARIHVDIYANVAPPPLRAEIVPPPRGGYVWVPGYWGWSRHHHRWHRGHWVRARHGYHYVPSRWDRDGDRWRYYDGRWER